MQEITLNDFTVVRQEPAVWVSRVMILEAIDPIRVIRDIPLKKGVNIIWARERATTSGVGHNAGKSSFCRLLRYCLGETGFARQINQKRIRALFPEGYVAAEIFVHGTKWAIARPLGSRHRTYAAENISIEEVFQKDHASFETFRVIVESSVLGDLIEQVIPSSLQTILWEHVLAWCARDQEARYLSIHSWRSPQSDSGTSKFEKPKMDAMFVMRAVLGLLFTDEVAMAQLIRKKEEEIAALKADIEIQAKEPAYWHNHYKSQLFKLLGEDSNLGIPLRSQDLFTADLERLATSTIEQVANDIKELNKKFEDVENELSLIYRAQGQNDTEIESIKSSLGIYDEKNNAIHADFSQHISIRQKHLDRLNDTCRNTRVSLKDCPHFMSQLNTLNLPDESRKRELKRLLEESAEAIRLLKEQLASFEALAIHLAKELKRVKFEKEGLRNQIQIKQTYLNNIRSTLDNLIAKSEQTAPNSIEGQLAPLRKKLQDLEKAVDADRSQLQVLPREFIKRLNQFQNIFSFVVKGVLGQGFNAYLQLDDGEITFDINNPGVFAGTAMATLTVQLADLSGMLYAVSGGGTHPGFLVHDSPREADIEIGIYHNIFRFMTNLEQRLAERGGVPFQYIITTTSAPPPEMDNSSYIVLELSGATEEELLYKKVFFSRQERESVQMNLQDNKN